MKNEHDFKKYPELTNSQMVNFYWTSPHKQIFEDFHAKVKKVKDGDTIQVECNFRNFDFPVRFSNIAAPELKEQGGEDSKKWLKERIEGKEVLVSIDYNNRVGKWGRLIGAISIGGMDIGLESIMNGHSVDWDLINEGRIIDPIR